MGKKTYSGFTYQTPESLLLDAGAFFYNFDLSGGITQETVQAAKDAGKCLGATKGGGEFKAVPTVRQIEVDGVKGRAKGLETIDSWDVSLKANVLEFKEGTIKQALCASTSETSGQHTKITANNYIELTDYIENLVWIGTLSGSTKPVAIEIKNALNTDGITITTADKAEMVLAMTFYAHYDDLDLDTPPFAIYYPTLVSVAPATLTVSTSSTASFNVSGGIVTSVNDNGVAIASTCVSTTTSGGVTIANAYIATLAVGSKHRFTFINDGGNQPSAIVTVS